MKNSPKEGKKSVSFEEKKLQTCLIGVFDDTRKKTVCEEHIRELAFLSETLELEVIDSYVCHVRSYIAATYLSKGHVNQLVRIAKEKPIDVFIFDDDITPAQQRNLEKLVKVPVIDRTALILDIFQKRASSKEAHLQISLAKQKYELPRLKGMWSHLSRQKGGSTNQKGEGEQQIEIDRRIVKRNIAKLEKELEKVSAHRKTQRRARMQSCIPTFAIIGYTNAGKSTLLNALTDANVLVEDKLFATLDTTTRKYLLPNKQEVLLIDTVGFIRKLPHTLVAAFRSTLEESVQADILIHLLDITDPMLDEHIQATQQLLRELHPEQKTLITVFNKCDACNDQQIIEQWKRQYPTAISLSAKEKHGLDTLFDQMIALLEERVKSIRVQIPQEQYKLVSTLLKEGKIHSQTYCNNDIIIEAEIPIPLLHQYLPWQV